MKLNYIKFNNHKVLGNLVIDFCIDGKPVSTIFIAGENGTGKTTVLDTIYKLSNIQPGSVTDGQGITYGLTLSEQQAESVSRHPNVNLPEVARLMASLSFKLNLKEGRIGVDLVLQELQKEKK